MNRPPYSRLPGIVVDIEVDHHHHGPCFGSFEPIPRDVIEGWFRVDRERRLREFEAAGGTIDLEAMRCQTCGRMVCEHPLPPATKGSP